MTSFAANVKSNLQKVEDEQPKALVITSVITSLLWIGVFALVVRSRAFDLGKIPAPVEAPVLEAELVEKVEPPHLHEAKATVSVAAPAPELAISKKLEIGKDNAKDKAQLMESSNQTTAPAPEPAATRGPQVDYAPAPIIPAYLKNQNLEASVLIEFTVAGDGSIKPNLMSTSGNEELDALALATARKWIFRPALKDGVPTSSKVRLRINFQVN